MLQEDSSFPRLALVLPGRREERVRCHAEELVGVGFIFPGLHGDPPVQHLHGIGGLYGAQAAWGRDARVEAMGL